MLGNVFTHEDEDDGGDDDVKERPCRIEILILSGVRVAIFPLPTCGRDITAHAIQPNTGHSRWPMLSYMPIPDWARRRREHSQGMKDSLSEIPSCSS